MGASVKVMLSHDYCHFEVSKSTDQDVTNEQIDAMRKDCMRLADKAIEQYKIAKRMAALRTDGQCQISNFKAQCERILLKQEGDRTINETAMIKRFQDENWERNFQYDYDYEDDFSEPEY